MSATAFKNAVRRREHYERHQPAARARFGLLEKHKDYVKRAKNYHGKEARIAELRKKAANRNPDEFYFKMTSGRGTKKGVAQGERAERPRLTADMLAVLKTQDKTYVQTQLNAETRKAERLRASLHHPGGRGGAPAGTHLSFDDPDGSGGGEEEDALPEWDALEDAVEVPAGAGSKRRRPEEEVGSSLLPQAQRKQAKRGAGAAPPSAKAAAAAVAAARKGRKKLEKLRRGSYAELEQRQERIRKLSTLAAHMDVTRALLQKGKRTKVADAEGEAPAVYVWKPQRKR